MSSDSSFYEVGDSNIPTIHLPWGCAIKQNAKMVSWLN
jgi:hypothetical protein